MSPAASSRYRASSPPATDDGGCRSVHGDDWRRPRECGQPRLQIYDNLTWTRGSHQVKGGAEFLWIEYNRTEAPSALGTFQFTSGYTSRTAGNDGSGHSLASFLLAQPQIGSRSVGPSIIEGRQPYFSAYLQDDWRVGDRVTLNLGLRYELAPPMYDRNGLMASVDYRGVPTPQEIFAEGRTNFYMPTVFICGQSGYPKGCAYTDKNNFAPRLGVVWRAEARTVVRAGAGVYYAATDANPLFRLAAGIPATWRRRLPITTSCRLAAPVSTRRSSATPAASTGPRTHRRRTPSISKVSGVRHTTTRGTAG